MNKELNIFYDPEWEEFDNYEFMCWRLGSNQNIISNVEIYRDGTILIHWQIGVKLKLSQIAIDISKKEYEFIVYKLAENLLTTKAYIKEFIKYE